MNKNLPYSIELSVRAKLPVPNGMKESNLFLIAAILGLECSNLIFLLNLRSRSSTQCEQLFRSSCNPSTQVSQDDCVNLQGVSQWI